MKTEKRVQGLKCERSSRGGLGVSRRWEEDQERPVASQRPRGESALRGRESSVRLTAEWRGGPTGHWQPFTGSVAGAMEAKVWLERV